jgi:phosphotransferase system HPr-like phosphotransfer protein
MECYPELPPQNQFDEKVHIFSYEYLKCCIYLMGTQPSICTCTKKLYAKLMSSSQLLEDLLDHHGAKNSRKWYFYRELSAAVRHLSKAAYSQKHIFNRLPYYGIKDTEAFVALGNEVHSFLIRSLQKLAPVIIEEAARLEIPFPRETFSVVDFPRITTPFMLDPDIDDEEPSQKTENVVRVAAEFLNIVDTFDEIGIHEPVDPAEIQRMVPASVNEVEIRRHEMMVHNLQSSFDSYVVHGGFHKTNIKLKHLRGYFSVALHLLELTGRLLHFYERHLHDVGYKNVYKLTRDRMAGIIDPERLARYTINYGLYYTCFFMRQGKDLAQEVLRENIQKDTIKVGIPVKLGFHTRPSLLVAKIVQRYGGNVEMVVGDHRFDAGSVLDIQWAGGKIQKENIQEVVFTGDQRALRDIAILAGVNYGEDVMGTGVPLPKELSYLR